jgi:hypothetical protein
MSSTWTGGTTKQSPRWTEPTHNEVSARTDENSCAAEGFVMDSFDRHLLQFVLTWIPFGGPTDEDTFPRFGLRAWSVHDRFIASTTLAGARFPSLDEVDADLIRRAQAHLHADRPRSSPAGDAFDRTYT